jgi:3-oxoacyl-[acyl-carrier-protein] synthase II
MLNLVNPDSAAEGLDLVRGEPRHMKIRHAVSNGFGFGGVNASIVFRKM